MFKVSPYKLRMFELCPQQYKFYYLDDLASQYKTAKPYLTMGAHVHNALHDFYSKLQPAQRNWTNLEQLLRKRWMENREGFAGVEDERSWGLKALKMLKLYLHKNNVANTPLRLEDYYDMDLTPDIKVLGRIDRVDQEPEGLHVIDYKTGKQDKDDLSETQLNIYAMIMSANIKEPVLKASYLFLSTNEWYTINIKKDEFPAVQAEILKQIEKIQAEKKFEPKCNKFCKHCDFLEICSKKAEIIKKINDIK